jgi:hypothetical protein
MIWMSPHAVRPEPVEGLCLFFERKEGQGFGKLSPNGLGLEAAE